VEVSRVAVLPSPIRRWREAGPRIDIGAIEFETARTNAEADRTPNNSKRRGQTEMAKRVFIAFAIEDEKARNLLRGQELNPQSPMDYTDMSVKEPWSEEWKTKCRERIKGCNGVIALLSKNSLNASGQRWEIKCAVEEKAPIIGVYIYSDDKSAPPEMDGIRKITWTWDGIAAFVNGL
jgi:hypothetical protein